MGRSNVVLLGLLIGCSTPTSGPEATFAPNTGAFFDTPWPSEARTTEEGALDWSAFPNPTRLTLLDTFLSKGMETVGAPYNAPIYFQFNDPIDTSALPSVAASGTATAVVQIVNVDPRSPDFGQRIPFQWEVRDTAGAYVPENLLAIAPLPGWSLAPETTYAAFVTTAVAQPAPAFQRAWSGDGDWGRALLPLRSVLPVLGLTPQDLAVATVFTTGNPTSGMDAVARTVTERIAPPTFTTQVEHLYDLGTYSVFRSHYTTPLFMHGDKPYNTEGGDFVYRNDGLPVVASWDAMRMSIVTPREETLPPEEGWPVVVYLHGTGGFYRNFANSDRDLEVATWLAPMGIVGIGIDFPLHGPRGTEDTTIDFHSFNVLQPDAAVHMHRQAAADLLYLLSGLSQAPTFVRPDGLEIPIDPDRIMVMGHSQGGLTSAIALPWMSELASGAVLSGAGGLLAITAVERDSDYDFPTLIRQLLDFDEEEELTELHPILGLVQSIVEPTDPINYAPYWFRRQGAGTGSPIPVLLTSGIRDDATPSRTAEALATAAGMPFAEHRYSAAVPMLLRDLDVTPYPVQDNVPAWDGSYVTGGLSQWASGDHFVMFQDPDARDVVRAFIGSTLLDDAAVIDADLPMEEAE